MRIAQSETFKIAEVTVMPNVITVYIIFLQIFSIHYFFAEGKKVKGMVRNGRRGRGGVGLMGPKIFLDVV